MTAETGEKHCHDCGCMEGEFHEPGCDMEVCPFCHGQLISCGCIYEKHGMDRSKLEAEHPYIYNNGPTPDMDNMFGMLLRERGLVPYFRWPVMCAYCGQTWPEFFSVPDEEWQRIVPEYKWHTVICRPCYDHLKDCVERRVAAEGLT